jgi:hypothetical protein
MKRMMVPVFVICAFGFSMASAQQVVYPAKGQSPQKQKEDEGACHTWAVDQSKFDPTKPPPPPPEPAAAPKGGRLRGAAAGAVVAEATGGDAGSGAAAGAVAGGVAQRNAARQMNAQQQQAAAAQQNAGMASYQKARAACLEGRGYTVK